MKTNVSIAIETTCRAGGVALGVGHELREAIRFDASSRHATHLISRLRDLLAGADMSPGDVGELYVSIGPGSFTGTRVAVTVARTLGQIQPGLRIVAVPTPWAIADGAADLTWQNLAVILDAREKSIFAALFRRESGRIVPADQPQIATCEAFLAAAPRPALLIGEGLAHHDLSADGVSIAPDDLHLPAPQAVWRVGRQLARDGQFTPAAELLPTYVRQPEAVRLWQRRQQGTGDREQGIGNRGEGNPEVRRDRTCRPADNR